MHRRRKQSGRRFERPERVCKRRAAGKCRDRFRSLTSRHSRSGALFLRRKQRTLLCPLSENCRPLPAKVPCGHFWRHLLSPKGGKRILCRMFRELLRDFPALSFEERAKEDRTAKMFGNVPLASLSDHARSSPFAAQKDAPLRLWRLGKGRKRPLHSPAARRCARSLRALGVRHVLYPTFSQCGIQQASGLLKIQS